MFLVTRAISSTSVGVTAGRATLRAGSSAFTNLIMRVSRNLRLAGDRRDRRVFDHQRLTRGLRIFTLRAPALSL